MHIAICGGTFDPFHRGHLEPLLSAREAMQWERVIYVPAWQQPFKSDRETTSGYHRFAMAVLATQRYDFLFVSDIELARGGTSYSVDTLAALHALRAGATFDWIIGDDHVAQLLQWREPDRLFELARFVVLTRGEGARRAPLPEALKDRLAAGRLVFARTPLVPVSATEIRQRVRNGESIDAFVDPLVSRYIQRNGLYKEGTA